MAEPPPSQPPGWPQPPGGVPPGWAAPPAPHVGGPPPAAPYGPQHGYAWAFPHPRPPEPPELPDGASPWPRWPAWYGFAGMGIGLGATLIAGALLGAIYTIAGGDIEDAGFNQLAVLVQDVAFIGAAVFMASRTMRPRLWHFGLRRTRFWPTVGWAAAGMGAFYVIVIVYSLLVRPEGEQDTLETLGTEESRLALIGVALLVIVIAPVTEELFFRAFFYRSLRTRLSVLPAALLNGTLFGAVHIGTPLELLPVLAILGVIFCLVYERTGNLFTVIALHSLNNFIAFGGATGEWGVAGIVGGATILACLTVPRLLPARAPALRPGARPALSRQG